MIYISIDIETTGTNVEKHQILEIALVIENTDAEILLPIKDLPKFHCIVESSDGQYHGEAFPINLNKRIFEILSKTSESNPDNIPIYKDYEIAKKIKEFLIQNGYRTSSEKSEQVTFHAAGKNFATFDKLFLERLPSWNKYLQITRRVLDPGILLVNWKEDLGLPNLETCKKRVGLKDKISHIALEDAYDVITILRIVSDNYKINKNLI